MEIHVLSTLAYENKKVTHPDKQTYIIARDTWMPSLENWGGGYLLFRQSHNLESVLSLVKSMLYTVYYAKSSLA